MGLAAVLTNGCVVKSLKSTTDLITEIDDLLDPTSIHNVENEDLQYLQVLKTDLERFKKELQITLAYINKHKLTQTNQSAIEHLTRRCLQLLDYDNELKANYENAVNLLSTKVDSSLQQIDLQNKTKIGRASCRERV